MSHYEADGHGRPILVPDRGFNGAGCDYGSESQYARPEDVRKFRSLEDLEKEAESQAEYCGAKRESRSKACGECGMGDE